MLIAEADTGAPIRTLANPAGLNCGWKWLQIVITWSARGIDVDNNEPLVQICFIDKYYMEIYRRSREMIIVVFCCYFRIFSRVVFNTAKVGLVSTSHSKKAN